METLFSLRWISTADLVISSLPSDPWGRREECKFRRIQFSNQLAASSGTQVTPAAPSSVSHRSQFSVTVTVEDAYGNVVTGYLGTIQFSSSDSSATLPANYTFTASDAGVHTFTSVFVLRTRGNQRLTATDTQNSSLTATDTITVT
jgi:hypothetical protein